MTERTTPRRTRALVALAGAALLGVTACGSEQDTAPADPEQTTVVEESEQGSEDPEQSEPAGEAPEPTDDDQTGDDQAVTDQPGDEVEGSDQGRSLVFVTEVEPEQLQEQDGERRVPAQHLAEILQDMGGVAEEPPADAEPAACETDLRYVAGADVRCTVTASFDGNDRDMVFHAHPITSPGGAAGVLFTADAPLTEEARWATFHEGVETVLLGQGGAYGMDPIPVDQLARDMQGVVDFDDWHGENGTEQWDLTVQNCEGELDFERLAPVRCNATDSEGTEVTMWALPGTHFGREPGLIVSAELGTDG